MKVQGIPVDIQIQAQRNLSGRVNHRFAACLSPSGVLIVFVLLCFHSRKEKFGGHFKTAVLSFSFYCFEIAPVYYKGGFFNRLDQG